MYNSECFKKNELVTPDLIVQVKSATKRRPTKYLKRTLIVYTRNAGCGRTELEHRVVTSYLNELTLPTKLSVHSHRYALQIRYVS